MKFNDLLEERFGPIECGSWCPNGWLALVLTTLEEARAIDKDLKVKQIKEKFGMLRLYVDSSHEEVKELISLTEEWSMSVCQECGQTGSQYTRVEHRLRDGWYSTLCGAHEPTKRTDDK